eukprot:scaffold262369_cov33-Tisochrysis_lutea.AAC.3
MTRSRIELPAGAVLFSLCRANVLSHGRSSLFANEDRSSTVFARARLRSSSGDMLDCRQR